MLTLQRTRGNQQWISFQWTWENQRHILLFQMYMLLLDQKWGDAILFLPNYSFFFLAQQFLMHNKLETAMWLSRLFTVYCSVMFILPILGWVLSADLTMTAMQSFLWAWVDFTVFATACVFQTLRSCKLLSESFVSERPHQCSSPASKASTLPAEQNVPGPGSAGGQLPLPALLSHPGQLLPHHKYPFTQKHREVWCWYHRCWCCLEDLCYDCDMMILK